MCYNVIQAQRTCGTAAPYFELPETAKGNFSLTATSADVQISGVIAGVELTQFYENKGKETIEATYVFPASDQAAIHALEMKIGKRTIEAQIEEKNKARKDYEKAKSDGRTAALLEQHRPNVFQMNVANILPGDKIEVRVLYSELLVPEESIYEFVLPKSVGPRFRGEDMNAKSDDWAARTNEEGRDEKLPQMDISVCVDAGMPIQNITSPSHQIAVSGKGDSKIITPDEKNPGNKTDDFILRYALKGKQIQQGLLLYEGAHENFFLMMMQAPERIKNEDIPPREYIFLMDVSGSMRGFPLDVSKKLLKNLVGNLRPIDKFNITFFAGGTNTLAEESLAATKENLDKAITMLESRSGGGGTRMLNAFHSAMSKPKGTGVSRSFVILTDGFVSVEKDCYEYIRNNLGQANFFAFGIGSRVNRHLINGIARAGAGEAFVVSEKELAEEKAELFRKYIQTPVLTNIKVAFDGVEAYDISPRNIPDLMAERPIIVYGKYKGKPVGKVNVSGNKGRKVFNQKMDFNYKYAVSKYENLAQLWARNEVKELGDYKKLSRSRRDSNLMRKITDLGLMYNIMTDYTSFIAIDSEIRNTTIGNAAIIKEEEQESATAFTKTQSFATATSKYPSYGLRSKKRKASVDGVELAKEVEIAPPRTAEPPPRPMSLSVPASSSPPPPPPPPEPEVEEIFRVVEEMPRFPGCEEKTMVKDKADCAQQKLLAFIYDNIRYPASIKEHGITGTSVVSFVVKKDGSIDEIRIMRSVHEEMNKEIIRLIKMMPKWIPGRQRGKAVDVAYNLPVRIKVD